MIASRQTQTLARRTIFLEVSGLKLYVLKQLLQDAMPLLQAERHYCSDPLVQASSFQFPESLSGGFSPTPLLRLQVLPRC